MKILHYLLLTGIFLILITSSGVDFVQAKENSKLSSTAGCSTSTSAFTYDASALDNPCTPSSCPTPTPSSGGSNTPSGSVTTTSSANSGATTITKQAKKQKKVKHPKRPANGTNNTGCATDTPIVGGPGVDTGSAPTTGNAACSNGNVIPDNGGATGNGSAPGNNGGNGGAPGNNGGAPGNNGGNGGVTGNRSAPGNNGGVTGNGGAPGNSGVTGNGSAPGNNGRVTGNGGNNGATGNGSAPGNNGRVTGNGGAPGNNGADAPCVTTQTQTTPKGIYEFSGKNSSADASNLYLAGTNLMYYWAQLEPQKGQYNWNLIDQDMQPWIDNGKNVILRVSTSGWTSWDKNANSGQGTPQWVYDSGVGHVTETDGSVLPEYWNPTFLQDLSDFVKAFASHYDGNSHVSAIQIGVGEGGETKVDTRKSPQSNPSQVLHLWQAIGYSDQIWWDTIQKIINIYIMSFHNTPLLVMPDNSFIGKTPGYSEKMVIDYAVSHNLWLQDNGLTANHTLKYDGWRKVPFVEEQLGKTTQTHDSLQAELQVGINLGATYILVFQSDIQNNANQAALQQATAQLKNT